MREEYKKELIKLFLTDLQIKGAISDDVFRISLEKLDNTRLDEEKQAA